MCLRIKVRNSVNGVRHTVSVTNVLGYNIATFGNVLHTILKLKNQGNFFYLFLLQFKKKTLTRRFGSDARGDRKLLYLCFGLNILLSIDVPK